MCPTSKAFDGDQARKGSLATIGQTCPGSSTEPQTAAYALTHLLPARRSDDSAGDSRLFATKPGYLDMVYGARQPGRTSPGTAITLVEDQRRVRRSRVWRPRPRTALQLPERRADRVHRRQHYHCHHRRSRGLSHRRVAAGRLSRQRCAARLRAGASGTGELGEAGTSATTRAGASLRRRKNYRRRPRRNGAHRSGTAATASYWLCPGLLPWRGIAVIGNGRQAGGERRSGGDRLSAAGD